MESLLGCVLDIEVSGCGSQSIGLGSIGSPLYMATSSAPFYVNRKRQVKLGGFLLHRDTGTPRLLNN